MSESEFAVYTKDHPVKVICDRCVREAEVWYSHASGPMSCMFLGVECHGVLRLVSLPEITVLKQKMLTKDAVVTILWSQLHDASPEDKMEEWFNESEKRALEAAALADAIEAVMKQRRKR